MLADKSVDREMRDLADMELPEVKERIELLEQDIQILLLPKDAADEKSAILEIRAGTGGSEAALFGGDLFRMYERFAANNGWKVEILSASDGEAGGYKEVIATITGKGVFSRLKFESGVHRVQRVPETEAGGRIHTSAATVAVLPEAEEIDIEIPRRGYPHRHHAFLRCGRPARQHDGLGGAYHPSSLGDRGDKLGKVAASEPRQGDAGAAFASL